MRIDKAETLRYLGYAGQPIDRELDGLVDACISECEHIAKGLFIYKAFDITERPDGVFIPGAELVLPGGGIRRHLQGCRRAVFLAATLGAPTDNRIRILQKTEMTKAVILDACAAACIESVCDEACDEIGALAEKEGLFATGRFSPGYDDLPLTLQKPLTDLLQTGKRIGLTVSGSGILLPRKSVTAIVGFRGQQGEAKSGGCDRCDKREDCLYRKSGESCGY